MKTSSGQLLLKLPLLFQSLDLSHVHVLSLSQPSLRLMMSLLVYIKLT